MRLFRASAAVNTRLFDGELVILDMDQGEYLSLDAIGSMLWAGLTSGRTIEDIAADVVAEYDVSLEQATRDLETLTADLVKRGLLTEEGIA